MGTNLTAPLDNGPQTGVFVYPTASPATRENSGPDTREVLRCLQCQLVQFRPQNSHCRRCHADLDAAPEPMPVVALDAGPDGSLEPGIETAEASGIPVPNVAAAIRLFRQRRGMSQRQLAERMHVPRTYVSKIENDKATPTIASLHRMAAAMDTGIASLIEPGPAPRPDAGQEDFIGALLHLLPKLGPKHRGHLLDASRQLSQA